MKYNPDKHHRRSIRLQGYDYSQPGIYFITLCTQNHECLFVVGVQNFEFLLFYKSRCRATKHFCKKEKVSRIFIQILKLN